MQVEPLRHAAAMAGGVTSTASPGGGFQRHVAPGDGPLEHVGLGTVHHWRLAEAASSCTKAVRIAAATIWRCPFGTCARTLRTKCNATSLPCRAEHPRDRGTQALVRVGDHQLHAAQTATRESAQELGPERFGLARSDSEPQNLPAPLGVAAHCDDPRGRYDASGAAHLDVGRIEPQIWPLALDGTLQEGIHPLVDLRAQPRHLALGDARHTHGLDQLTHRARRHTLHVGLTKAFSAAVSARLARLQEGWEVAALPELRDARVQRAGTRLPAPLAVPVAVVDTLRTPLARSGGAAVLDADHAPLVRPRRCYPELIRMPHRGGGRQKQELGRSPPRGVIPIVVSCRVVVRTPCAPQTGEKGPVAARKARLAPRRNTRKLAQHIFWAAPVK